MSIIFRLYIVLRRIGKLSFPSFRSLSWTLKNILLAIFYDQNEMSFSFKCLLNVILETCDEKEK